MIQFDNTNDRSRIELIIIIQVIDIGEAIEIIF